MPPLRARGARLIAVSDVRAVLRRAQTRLPLALLRDRDLDQPLGLRKVTMTR